MAKSTAQLNQILSNPALKPEDEKPSMMAKY